MSNKSVRELLVLKYGEKCMFLKAHIPERLKGTTIKSYRRFKKEMHFTLEDIQTLESILTLHHLIHEAEGGETSEENGAVVNELAHRYMHSLPKEHEEVINDMLREYKSNFKISGGVIQTAQEQITVTQPFILDISQIEDDYIEVPVMTYRKEEKTQEKIHKKKHKKSLVKKRSNKKDFREGGGRFR